MNKQGYNRNLIGGKRQHRKITRFDKCKTLTERLIVECKALRDYQIRVNQLQINL